MFPQIILNLISSYPLQSNIVKYFYSIKQLEKQSIFGSYFVSDILSRSHVAASILRPCSVTFFWIQTWSVTNNSKKKKIKIGQLIIGEKLKIKNKKPLKICQISRGNSCTVNVNPHWVPHLHYYPPTQTQPNQKLLKKKKKH